MPGVRRRERTTMSSSWLEAGDERHAPEWVVTHLWVYRLLVLLGLTLLLLALWRFGSRLAVSLGVAVGVSRYAFLIMGAFRRRRERLRNRRRWAHRCVVCGYSLTGN